MKPRYRTLFSFLLIGSDPKNLLFSKVKARCLSNGDSVEIAVITTIVSKVVKLGECLLREKYHKKIVHWPNHLELYILLVIKVFFYLCYDGPLGQRYTSFYVVHLSNQKWRSMFALAAAKLVQVSVSLIRSDQSLSRLHNETVECSLLLMVFQKQFWRIMRHIWSGDHCIQ